MVVSADTATVGVRAELNPHDPPTDSAASTLRFERRSRFLALALLAATVLATALRRLPTGVCFGDAGELQLAGTVLGVAHSPGYAAYVSLAHVATYLPGVSPAYAVTVLCLVAGVVSLALAAMLAMRLGVHPWVACAAALALTSHPRVWQNIITPEVYILSIAFMLAAAYRMTVYLRDGARRTLFLAAFLLGVAIANRPPVLVVAPFFIWCWWRSPHRVRGSVGSATRTFALLALSASLPGVYSLSYFFLRDTPTTTYNYVEQHNAETPELPAVADGIRAKVERIRWLVTAREFYYLAGSNWSQIKAKLRWLRWELFSREPAPMIAVALLAAIGMLRAFQRTPSVACLVAAIGLHAFLYNLYCRNSGQAADTLPILMALAIFAAVGFNEAVPAVSARLRSVLGVGVFVVAVAFTFRDLPDRPAYGSSGDASGFLADVRMKEMPKDSVILSFWTHAAALIYERSVVSGRNDIDVIISQPGSWRTLAQRYPSRPVYVSVNSSQLASKEPIFEHNLWRLVPPAPSNSPQPTETSPR